MNELTLNQLLTLHNDTTEQLEYLEESISLEFKMLHLANDDFTLNYLLLERSKLVSSRNKYKRMIKSGKYTR